MARGYLYDPYATMPEMKGLGRPIFYTFDYVRDLMAALSSEYATVGKELNAALAPCLPTGCGNFLPFVQQVWTPLKDAWDVFEREHQSRWTLTGGAVDTIDDYRNRLRDFRASARKQGFAFTSPEPREPPESPVTSLTKTIRFIVIGGAVLGGLALLYKVLPRK